MKITVRAKADSFRRAGLAFVKTPQTFDVDQKTFDLLRAEPMLVVEEVEETHPHPAPLPEGEGMKKKGKGK